MLFFFLLAVAFAAITGASHSSRGSWVFLNRTSLHSLYCARLIRAYLGASNKTRYGDDAGISDPVDGDDIPQDPYWLKVEHAFWEKGAPLHLVNVTINETLDGRTQTEQRDRKGLGMAIGPAGFSVGVRHHVVYTKETERKPGILEGVEIFPKAAEKVFAVFNPGKWGELPKEDGHTFSGQSLSLGNWTAISGAAVSTGLGSRTSLGISLLTGLFNVRLGYWWNSGTRSVTAGWKLSRSIGKVMAAIFPVQSCLIDEFMGRFHGTLRKYWYLTDGGHFEDLGAYELIRRRLPLIVVIDAECDSEYDFAELANLIRKARLDFNAEIAFIDPKDEKAMGTANAEIQQHFNAIRESFFGTLDQLRRGRWSSEPVDENEQRVFFKTPNIGSLSRKHAALARVTYLDDPLKVHHLLLIKPTLIGEEPEDVLNYHSANPSFPQETTADQYFDEAQWESYRRLGQHIAERIFGLI